ncbi:hypothetical protein Daus18300_001849 [Diaporthe australafricana]|uniref:Uncharacterized protein n=1 Tax=Diaporthe australafricana TaxID=127596 RepID=A0ABR3XUC1_9PEZI
MRCGGSGESISLNPDARQKPADSCERNVSKTISLEERDKYWRRSEIYRKWLLDRVFDADSKSVVTVMIFPIEAGKPKYREAELPPLSILPGFASSNMSPMMRAPELTAPVSVIGAPGADLILANLVGKGLKGAGLPTKVNTGRSVFGQQET